jgi:hypothetical protein
VNNRLPNASKLLVTVILSLVSSLLTSVSTPANATPTPTCATGGVCALGDTGPGGGKVFYVDSVGFSCGAQLTNTCYYLEAATTSTTPSWIDGDNGSGWLTRYNVFIDGTLSDIGAGYFNTLELLRVTSRDGYEAPAASIANNYRGGGKDDWYLPSLDELQELYTRKALFSDLYNARYSSSTRSGGLPSPLYIDFQSDEIGTHGSGDISFGLYNRPIRAFTGSRPPSCGKSAKDGAYTVVKFLNTGNCRWSIPTGVTELRGLIVGGGGGGGGGGGKFSGGGGGGGYLEFETLTVTSQTLTITVGRGGLGGGLSESSPRSTNGQDSKLIGTGLTLTAAGGGAGGSGIGTGYSAQSGGSGGGSGLLYNTSYPDFDLSFGESATPISPILPGGQTADSIGLKVLGNDGAPFCRIVQNQTVTYPSSSGGGGGAGASSECIFLDNGATTVSHGGAGYLNNILGRDLYWAGGGGGGNEGYQTNRFIGGNGGIGGGGGGGAFGEQSAQPRHGLAGALGLNPSTRTPQQNLEIFPNTDGGNGGANTGGGGGGGGYPASSGGNGGSGIVVLRYLTPGNPPPPSTDATLSSVTIKGKAVQNFGTGSSDITAMGIGSASLRNPEAMGSGSTSFLPTYQSQLGEWDVSIRVALLSADEDTVTAAALEDIFNNHQVYGGEVITVGSFFLVKVTAQDGVTFKYYRINNVITTCGGESYSCVPGDLGPSGGIIFYASTEPFSCGPDFLSLCLYLEAAPREWAGGGVVDPAHYFKADNIIVDGVNQNDLPVPGILHDSRGAGPNMNPDQIGLGYKNSVVLSAFDTSTGNAGVAARGYTGGNKSDWYLPTLAELRLLCQFSHGQTPNVSVGCDYTNPLNTRVPSEYAFLSSAYISSSGSVTNWHENFVLNADSFGNFEHNDYNYGSSPYSTRPIRAFAPEITNPSKLSVTRAPSGAARRTAFTTPPQVTIQNASGIQVFSATDTVTASVSTGGTLFGTTAVKARSGRATFSNLGIDGVIGETYTITFTVAGLTAATTTITPTGTTCNGASFACQEGDIRPAILGVTAPVRGATPVTSVTPGTGYTGDISWSGDPSRFGSATSYTATITLTADDGYTFAGVPANFFTVTGATSVTNAANSNVIEAVFPATGVFSGAVSLTVDRLILRYDSDQISHIQTNAPEEYFIGSFYKDLYCGDSNFYLAGFGQIAADWYVSNGLYSYYTDCTDAVWIFRIYENANIEPDLTTPYLASISVLIVNGSTQIPFIASPTSSSTYAGTVGTSFNLTSIYNSGVAPETFTVSIGALPPGLTLNQSGVISGVPTTAGSYTVSITLTDFNNEVSTVSDVTFEITGSSPPPPPAPQPEPVQVPSPTQESKISELSVSSSKAGVKTPVVVTGNFMEKITNISINGDPISRGDWVQTATTISFTVPALTAGQYEIQLYNGSAPLMKSLKFIVEKVITPTPVVTKTPRAARTPRPVITPTLTPTPTPTTKAPVTAKVITIKCVKGKTVKLVKGVKPKCPKGYVKK